MYEFNVSVNMPVDDAAEALLKALQEEKFGIVSEIDVQAVMKKKLDRDIGPYRILGACNPGLASKVIDALPNAGTLLPCNVVVRAEGEGSVISFMDPEAMLSLADEPSTTEVGKQAKEALLRVCNALAS